MSQAGSVSSSDPPAPSNSATESDPALSPRNTGLYLYTFLVTLLLLLGVSLFVLSRSYIQRRRFRRRFEEALRTGQVITPFDSRFPGISRKILGPQPKMWDVWIKPQGDQNQWEGMMPLSAEIVQRHPVLLRRDPPPRLWMRSSSSQPPLRIPDLMRRRTSSTNTASTPTMSIPPTPLLKDQEEDMPKLRISALIAMPDPARPTSTQRVEIKGKRKAAGRRETPVPPLMVGVVDLDICWKATTQQKVEDNHPVTVA